MLSFMATFLELRHLLTFGSKMISSYATLALLILIATIEFSLSVTVLRNESLCYWTSVTILVTSILQFSHLVNFTWNNVTWREVLNLCDSNSSELIENDYYRGYRDEIDYYRKRYEDRIWFRRKAFLAVIRLVQRRPLHGKTRVVEKVLQTQELHRTIMSYL